MVFRSPYPDVIIPEEPFTPFVLKRAAELGDKPALIDGLSGRTITYQQLAGAVRLAAVGLARRGFGKGDVLGIFCPNLPEYAIAFHAVSLLGGINTTINALYTPDEIAFQLKDAGAKFLLTVPPFMDRAVAAAKQANIQEIFVFGEAAGATPFAELLRNDGTVPDVTINPREDVVVLPYSSGTTGMPKGVMLTHHNLVANLSQLDCIRDATERDVVMGVLPFFHIYGMVVILSAGLWKGATIVTMPRFDLEQFLQTMQQYQITRAYLVPPIVLALAKHPLVDNYDLSTLKAILSGAAPLGEDVARACSTRLGCIIKQGYGMTETSPVTHASSDDEVVNPGSVGRLIANTECRIVDPETGQDVGPHENGEIWIRGPQVMKGYLNQPEATAATIDSEGWLHTGDIGYIDDGGSYYVVDRVKELIKYKGYQVAPAELEAILLSHPAVADAAVIPSPEEESSEVPKAFVVLKGQATTDEILEHVAGRVAPHKKIRRIELVDEIPKSAAGKILRRVLVERERAQTIP